MNQPINSCTVWLENKLREKVNMEEAWGGMTTVVMTGQEAPVLKITGLSISIQLAKPRRLLYRNETLREKKKQNSRLGLREITDY